MDPSRASAELKSMSISFQTQNTCQFFSYRFKVLSAMMNEEIYATSTMFIMPHVMKTRRHDTWYDKKNVG